MKYVQIKHQWKWLNDMCVFYKTCDQFIRTYLPLKKQKASTYERSFVSLSKKILHYIKMRTHEFLVRKKKVECGNYILNVLCKKRLNSISCIIIVCERRTFPMGILCCSWSQFSLVKYDPFITKAVEKCTIFHPS